MISCPKHKWCKRPEKHRGICSRRSTVAVPVSSTHDLDYELTVRFCLAALDLGLAKSEALIKRTRELARTVDLQ
jgi:hypothetical protein